MERTPREKQGSQFLIFWEAYPKRSAKIDAQKAWRQINPSEDDVTAILQGIGRYVRSGLWDDRPGFPPKQFIPLPASFLRGRRWEDDLGSKTDEQPDREHCLFKKGYVPRQMRA